MKNITRQHRMPHETNSQTANIPQRHMHWAIGVLFSISLPAFNITINSQHKTNPDTGKILISAFVTFLFLMGSWVLNAHLIHSFGRPSSSRLQKLARAVAVVLCNTVLLALFLYFGTRVVRNWTQPSLAANVSYWLIAIKALVSIGLMYIIQYALISVKRAQEVSLQNEKLKTENLRAQFEILRQQINPHFLFNTLSALRAMVRANHPNSERFVIKLSDMYRSMLQKRQDETTSLRDEIAHIKDYAFLLEARFGPSLTWQIDVPDQLMSRLLPTFSLQLLVENCIKHNQISSSLPLAIRIYSPLPDHVAVANQMQPKITREAGSGYGLSNLTERYKLLGCPDGPLVSMDDNLFVVSLKLLQP
ncbi:MAG: histidine kinase [Breznakibacter sp.]